MPLQIETKHVMEKQTISQIKDQTKVVLNEKDQKIIKGGDGGQTNIVTEEDIIP